MNSKEIPDTHKPRRFKRVSYELTPFQYRWNNFWMWFHDRLYLIEHWLERRRYQDHFLHEVSPDDPSYEDAPMEEFIFTSGKPFCIKYGYEENEPETDPRHS